MFKKINPGDGSPEQAMEFANFLLSERGYVVIGLRTGHENTYKVGDTVRDLWRALDGHPFYLVAETVRADWEAQTKALSDKFPSVRVTPDSDLGGKFFKAVTD